MNLPNLYLYEVALTMPTSTAAPIGFHQRVTCGAKRGKRRLTHRTFAAFAISAMIACGSTAVAADPAAVGKSPATSETVTSKTGPNKMPAPGPGADSSLYVELRLNQRVKLSALRPGDIVEGRLSRDVYAGDRKVFQSGSPIRLTVGKFQRRRREPNPNWPGVIRLFVPRHENYPTFQSASVLLPGGAEVPLRVSLMSAGYKTDLHAHLRNQEKTTRQRAVSPKNQNREAGSEPIPAPSSTGSEAGVSAKTGRPKTQDGGQTVIFSTTSLTLNSSTASLSGETHLATAPPPQPATIAAGTQAQIILLDGLSASQNHPGDSFRASLLEPVRLGSRTVLPEGSLFDGRVVKTTPARWLSRPGSLLVVFTGLTLPGGDAAPVTASLSELEVDRSSKMRLDPEGKLSGGRPGTAWMLINLGVSGGIAKATDDTAQLLIEAIVSSATDVSTAGGSRIVAGCVSGFFMLTRRGRDAILPKFSKMTITFTRPVSVAVQQSATAVQPEGEEGEMASSHLGLSEAARR